MMNIKKILAFAFVVLLTYGLSLKSSQHQKTQPYLHDAQKICICPPEYPYDNKKECVKCDLPSYWNFTSLKC